MNQPAQTLEETARTADAEPTVDDIALTEMKEEVPEQRSGNHVASDIC